MYYSLSAFNFLYPVLIAGVGLLWSLYNYIFEFSILQFWNGSFLCVGLLAASGVSCPVDLLCWTSDCFLVLILHKVDAPICQQ